MTSVRLYAWMNSGHQLMDWEVSHVRRVLIVRACPKFGLSVCILCGGSCWADKSYCVMFDGCRLTEVWSWRRPWHRPSWSLSSAAGGSTPHQPICEHPSLLPQTRPTVLSHSWGGCGHFGWLIRLNCWLLYNTWLSGCPCLLPHWSLFLAKSVCSDQQFTWRVHRLW